MSRMVFSVILAYALCACTVLGTQDLANSDNPGDRGVGYSYSLAKAVVLIRLRVKADEARFLLCVSEEKAVEDDRHQYLLSFHNNAFSADKIDISTNSGTSILSKIDVKAIDQSDKFAVNLARAFGSFGAIRKESGELTNSCTDAANMTDLANIYMDPGSQDDVDEKLRILNHVLMEQVDRGLQRCADQQAEPKWSRDACREYKRIEAKFRVDQSPIKMKWDRPKTVTAAPDPQYCSTGVCYRPRLPYMLNVSMTGNAVMSQPFSLPNNSPLVAIDISRGFAITKATTITFDRLGQPTQLIVKKGSDDNGTDGSEAVELATLPVDVINAFFASAATTLQTINGAVSNQATLLQARADLIDKQNALDEKSRDMVRKESGTDSGNLQFVMQVGNAVSPGPASGSGDKSAGVNDQQAVRPGQSKDPPSQPGIGSGPLPH
jgi:hypothetical protein